MFVYTDTEYYLYNIYTKKFLGHPLLLLFELNSMQFENFPTYTHNMKNALKLRVKKPISDITAAGSNNLVVGSGYITGTHLTAEEPEQLQSGEEFILHVGEENGVHTHLFVTGTAISRPTFQDILEDGLVNKPLRMFYLSKQIFATGGTDLFSAEQRGRQKPIEAFTPMALVDGVSGNHVDFPSDPAGDSANQQAHVAGENIDDYIFQWMLVPVVVYSGAGCTPSEANEILVPHRSRAGQNFRNVFKNSAGVAFFSQPEFCEAYNREQNTNTVVGWQCLDRGVSRGCFSVTKNSLVVGTLLHKNVGECLEQCEATRDTSLAVPATPAEIPGNGRVGGAVAVSNGAKTNGGAAAETNGAKSQGTVDNHGNAAAKSQGTVDDHGGAAAKSHGAVDDHGQMKQMEGYMKENNARGKTALGGTIYIFLYIVLLVIIVLAIIMARKFLL